MLHPNLIHPEEEWLAHLAEGRLMIQRSRSTGGHVFFPRVAEPGTGAEDLEWVEASGRGTVHAVTVVRKRDPSEDYNVALVDLAEGPRMMSRVDGTEPGDVAIGMPVQVRIVSDAHGPLVTFVPA
jgi:uncharacterized OB-fold protein